MAQALSSGTLLKALMGKRVYQPIWQVVSVREPPVDIDEGRPQLAVTDGTHVGYVTICLATTHITYLKNSWKHANFKKNFFDVFYPLRMPYVKIIDYECVPGAKVNLFVVKKLKLLGWEKDNGVPDILKQKEIRVILSNGKVKKREYLPSTSIFDLDVRMFTPEDDVFSINHALVNSHYQETGNPFVVGKANGELPAAFDPEVLAAGPLSILGAGGLNILKICADCQKLAYQMENTLTSFRPPTKNFARLLQEMELAPPDLSLEFCNCSTDDMYTSMCREFQNKCMVVNQDSSSDLRTPKVQCVIVDRTSKPPQDDSSSGVKAIRDLTTNIAPVRKADAKPSNKLRICESCGVEETQMSPCRQCSKVWYCSPACKRADVKAHATLCRAYITVRRWKLDKQAFSNKLLEPFEGCENCGFWRESLRPCERCAVVNFCCQRCQENGDELHKHVCEAFAVIDSYREKKLKARKLEVD